jgi:hypothetical protein
MMAFFLADMQPLVTHVDPDSNRESCNRNALYLMLKYSRR